MRPGSVCVRGVGLVWCGLSGRAVAWSGGCLGGQGAGEVVGDGVPQRHGAHLGETAHTQARQAAAARMVGLDGGPPGCRCCWASCACPPSAACGQSWPSGPTARAGPPHGLSLRPGRDRLHLGIADPAGRAHLGCPAAALARIERRDLPPIGAGSPRGGEAAPAEARTRIPSCATRSSVTMPRASSTATEASVASSQASWAVRKSDSVWWFRTPPHSHW